MTAIIRQMPVLVVNAPKSEPSAIDARHACMFALDVVREMGDVHMHTPLPELQERYRTAMALLARGAELAGVT